jgi:peptide/nickel transport system substrate-binding protein
VLAAAMMLLTACERDATPADGDRRSAGAVATTTPVLRVGLEADLQGFDPLRTRLMGVSTLTVADTVFDTLVTVRDDGRILPRLALSLTPSDDLTEWRAMLRDDVVFHDGSPFDAAAVAGHFNRLLDPENRCSCRAFLGPMQRVSAVSAHEVVFELSAPWAALPAVLGEPSLVSLIGSPTARTDADTFNRLPIGTGPYRFVEWRPGESIAVARFDQYWDSAAPASFDAVTFRVLPDQQARFAALRAGDVDVLWTLDGATAVRAEQMGMMVTRHQGAGARILVLNTRKPPLDDVRVRRALAHAVDGAAYMDAVSDGAVAPATDPFGPGSTFTCESTWPRHDPAMARQLLQQYGQPVSLRFGHTATPRGQATGQIFQQFWQSVGIDVELVPMEQVQLVGSVVRRQYQVGPWRLRDSVDPDADLFGLFHSASPLNVTGLSAPALDELLLAARSVVDVNARRETYCALEQYLSQNVPYLFLGQNTYFAIASGAIGGSLSLRGGLLGLRAARPAG